MADGSLKNSLLHDSSLGTISGISISSFLQMLEQERHSCRVFVESDEKQGFLFFTNGELVDAECGQLTGTDAAYQIISWHNPSIALNDSVARSRDIELPLGHILLNAAKQQDELKDTMSEPTISYTSGEAEQDPDLQAAVTIHSTIRGIHYFYILNKAGKIVVHSAPNLALGELIIYCVITSSNLRKTLNTKSPRRIHMQMEDGTSLLIIPKAGKILGMTLDENSSAEDVADQIHAAFAIQ